jgi:hypothetical protein
VLDPDVVYRADAAAVQLGGPGELRGAEAVAEQYLGKAQAARVVLLDGEFGVRVKIEGVLLLVLQIDFRDGRISAIEAVADSASIAGMDVETLEESAG